MTDRESEIELFSEILVTETKRVKKQTSVL
jgi:hypothetical protein